MWALNKWVTRQSDTGLCILCVFPWEAVRALKRTVRGGASTSQPLARCVLPIAGFGSSILWEWVSSDNYQKMFSFTFFFFKQYWFVIWVWFSNSRSLGHYFESSEAVWDGISWWISTLKHLKLWAHFSSVKSLLYSWFKHVGSQHPAFLTGSESYLCSSGKGLAFSSCLHSATIVHFLLLFDYAFWWCDQHVYGVTDLWRVPVCPVFKDEAEICHSGDEASVTSHTYVNTQRPKK